MKAGASADVVVVGGSSLLARSILQHCSRAGIAVLTAGRRPEDNVFLDLTDDGVIDSGGRTAKVMIQCAASFGGNGPEDILLNARVNALGALRAGQFAQAMGVTRIICLSSIFAIDHPDNQYHESYGISKRQGAENLALFCRAIGVQLAIVCPSQIIDVEGESRAHQPLFWNLIDRAATGQDIVIFGGKDPLRDYVTVTDVARAVTGLLNRWSEGTHYCVSGAPRTVSSLAQEIQTIFGRGGRVLWDRDREDLRSIHIPGPAAWSYLGVEPVPLTEMLVKIAAVKRAER